MQKIYLILFILLFASAATAGNSKLSIGFSAGPNFTNLNYDNISDFGKNSEYKYNYQYSGFMEFRISQLVSIQAGFRYTDITNRVNVDQGIYDYELPDDFVKRLYKDISHEYLFFPLLVKYNLPIFINSYVLTGIEFGHLSSGSSELHYSNGDIRKDYHGHKIDNYNLTIDFGLGIEKKISSFNLFISFIYAHGLLDIHYNENWGLMWKSREFYATAGFTYLL